jgi:hypothetical protein
MARYVAAMLLGLWQVVISKSIFDQKGFVIFVVSSILIPNQHSKRRTP